MSSQSQSKALEIRSLRKSYEGFTLDNISFDVPNGYITGFIGPNGAGKTTTIKLLLDIAMADSGSVRVFGEEKSIYLNNQIGVVTDEPPFADFWSCDDLESVLSAFYDRWDKLAFDSHLKRFEIDRKKAIKELSRGMKVKLMIAVALSHDAKILVLDEPTSGLDPVARDEICTLLGDFICDEKHSVLFSTHITSDLEKIADYVVFILDGRLIFNGSKEELIENFVHIKGGRDELSVEQRALVIGIREHGTGFAGMASISDIEKLPNTAVYDPITLDEMIIYFNKELKNNA
ncbi:MAG TPA: ABC transporter ATP-binding protein [Coriobacteriia bacterium]|nr:ABC transporter ATP-binding protein [Coriobacteriia bacterium]